MAMQARVPLGELDQWVTQLRKDVQNRGLNNEAFHQRVTQFLAEHQRREANGRTALEQRVAQLKHEFEEAMTETAISFTRISQEFHGRGARREQLRQLVHTGLMKEMEELRIALAREGVRVTQVTREHEQFSIDIGNSLRVCIDEQKDQREMIRNLAQPIGTFRSRTTPGGASSGNNATPEPVSSETVSPQSWR